MYDDILLPTCADTDGTLEMCPSLTTCGLCSELICEDHSDALTPSGESDPQHSDRFGIVHRVCLTD